MSVDAVPLHPCAVLRVQQLRLQAYIISKLLKDRRGGATHLQTGCVGSARLRAFGEGARAPGFRRGTRSRHAPRAILFVEELVLWGWLYQPSCR